MSVRRIGHVIHGIVMGLDVVQNLPARAQIPHVRRGTATDRGDPLPVARKRRRVDRASVPIPEIIHLRGRKEK